MFLKYGIIKGESVRGNLKFEFGPHELFKKYQIFVFSMLMFN